MRLPDSTFFRLLAVGLLLTLASAEASLAQEAGKQQGDTRITRDQVMLCLPCCATNSRIEILAAGL